MTDASPRLSPPSALRFFFSSDSPPVFSVAGKSPRRVETGAITLLLRPPFWEQIKRINVEAGATFLHGNMEACSLSLSFNSLASCFSASPLSVTLQCL